MNTDTWNFERRITTPAPSCLERHRTRLVLSRLLIGDTHQFDTALVTRTASHKYEVTGVGKGYSYNAVLTMLETGIFPAPTPAKARKPRPRKPARKPVVLPLSDLPLFREVAA